MNVMTWYYVRVSQIDLTGVKCHLRPRDITGPESHQVVLVRDEGEHYDL